MKATSGPANLFYASDAKIDDLYDRFQPLWLLRLLDQIGGLTIGAFGIVVGGTRNRSQRTRRQKLKRVQRSLARSGEIGGIDEPKSYLFGRIKMHYGAFEMVNPPVMYLIGETERTIVALGGSLKNVQGRDANTIKRVRTHRSFCPRLRLRGRSDARNLAEALG
jgi:hypothetical protein